MAVPIQERAVAQRALLLYLSGLLIAACFASPVRAVEPKRARPPKFPKSISDVFFPDAREKLVGPQPQRSSAPADKPTALAGESAVGEVAGAAKRLWSKLIAAEAIEDEIKSQERKLAQAVQSAAKFKGGEYKQARVHLGVLATLFAIDAQYDQPMRWQREAAGVRNLVARAGFNCKVGTDASYREAKQVSADLEGLVRGGSIDAPKSGFDGDWGKVADRSVLMKRLEQAQEQSLAPWTANASEFARRVDVIGHEAQVVAAVAEVIQADGYEFADDDTYRSHAQDMQAQALAVRDSAAQNNYEQTRKAVGEMSKACTSCHDGYRN